MEGHQEVNRMETDLDMGGYDIVNAANLNANGTVFINQMNVDGRLTVGGYLKLNGVVTEGSTCDTDGLIARDADGSLMLGGFLSVVWTMAGDWMLDVNWRPSRMTPS